MSMLDMRASEVYRCFEWLGGKDLKGGLRKPTQKKISHRWCETSTTDEGQYLNVANSIEVKTLKLDR